MSRRLAVAALVLGLSTCTRSNDLTVAPLPQAGTRVEVEIPPPLETGRLVDWVEPRRYALALDVDPTRRRFRGEVTIDVSLARSSSAIVLHAADLAVIAAEVTAGDLRMRAEPSLRAAAASPEGTEEELVLVTPSPIPAGDAKVRIEYTAPLDETLRGIYRVQEGERSYVFTQLEPSDARRLLPCFDDPVYKVPFALSVTVPGGNAVFSNARQVRHVAEPTGGRETFVFEPTLPMPTYLLALAIGPFEVRDGGSDPIPMRVITVPGKADLGHHAIRLARVQLEQLGRYFGREYPYAKLDLVAVPNFGAGAMENAGLVMFREERLLIDPRTASAREQQAMAATMVHELAHQWFGNLVTMKWWDDLWLNEGFATYLEAVITDRITGTDAAGLDLLREVGAVMEHDTLDTARAVRQPVRNTYEAVEAFDPITYVKGAAILGMLRAWVGKDAFQEGVRAYVSRHAWSNATATDLFGALRDASGRDVQAVASTFLDTPGVPLVQIDVRCPRGEGPSLLLSQSRHRSSLGTSALQDPRWSVPVCVRYGVAGSTAPKRACTLLEDASTTLALDGRCPTWVHPNDEVDGYYRFVFAQAEQHRALVERTPELGVRNAVGALSNAWALTRAGRVPATELMTLLHGVRRDTRLPVQEEVIAALHGLSDAVVADAVRPSFQSFARSILEPRARALGWVGRPSDTEGDRLARLSVLTAMALLTEDGWVTEEARTLARAYIASPGSVSPDTAALALRVAARRGGVSFEEVLRLHAEARTPPERVAAVQALVSFRDPALVQRALGLLADGTLRAQDAVYVMRAMLEWADARAVLVSWLGDNLARLSPRLSGFGLARLFSLVGHMCTQADLDRALAVLEPHATNVPSAARRLREGRERAELCIDMRRRQEAAVTTLLTRRSRW